MPPLALFAAICPIKGIGDMASDAFPPRGTLPLLSRRAGCSNDTAELARRPPVALLLLRLVCLRRQCLLARRAGRARPKICSAFCRSAAGGLVAAYRRPNPRERAVPLAFPRSASAIVVRQRFFGIFWPLFFAGSEWLRDNRRMTDAAHNQHSETVARRSRPHRNNPNPTFTCRSAAGGLVVG